MKMLLLKPPDGFYTEENGTSNPQGDPVFPYSLGVMAELLRRESVDQIVALDAMAEKMSSKDTASAVFRENPDYLIVNVNILNIDSWIGDISCLKETIPMKFRLIALINKPFPEEILRKYGCIDAVIFREWLWATLDLIRYWDSRYKVKGIYLRKGKKIVFTGKRKHVHIKHYPLPAYDLFPIKKYRNYFTLWSHGCPHSCLFCHFGLYPESGWESRWVEDIIAEIELLQGLTKKRPLPLFVMDNEPTANPSFMKSLCREIIRRKLDVLVDANTRASTIDDELARLMSRAGMILLGIGIESGEQEILDLNNKELTISQIKKAVRLMNKHGISHNGYIMIGMRGDTRTSIIATYNFVTYTLRLKNANMGITIPYPNTPFYKLLKSRGYIKSITMENIKWIYKHIYGCDFIVGDGARPYWKVNDGLDFDDLVEIYSEMKPALPSSKWQARLCRVRHKPSSMLRKAEERVMMCLESISESL